VRKNKYVLVRLKKAVLDNADELAWPRLTHQQHELGVDLVVPPPLPPKGGDARALLSVRPTP
jgi:hypothetical protein